MRLGRIIAVLVLGSLGFLYARPWFERFPEQDACTFGPVSNVRYRAMKAEAERRLREVWPSLGPLVPFTGFIGLHGAERDALEARLSSWATELAGPSPTIYEQIAAIHALMRALGAEYRMTGFGRHTDYEIRDGVPAQLKTFSYALDVHRLGSLSPWARRAAVHVSLLFRPMLEQSLPQAYRPVIDVGVLWPTALDQNVQFADSLPKQKCPIVPSPEWVTFYKAWLASELKKVEQQ